MISGKKHHLAFCRIPAPPYSTHSQNIVVDCSLLSKSTLCDGLFIGYSRHFLQQYIRFQAHYLQIIITVSYALYAICCDFIQLNKLLTTKLSRPTTTTTVK